MDGSYGSGDYENARRYSNVAKWLSLISVILSVSSIVIVTVYYFAFASAATVASVSDNF